MSELEASSREAVRILRDWDQMHLAEACLWIVGGFGLSLMLKAIVPWLADRVPSRFRFWVLPWQPILRLAIWVVVVSYTATLIIHPTPENLLAISGALAVAVGFAFKDYASSLIAGVVALYERPYRVGDWVEIEGVYGEVQAIDLRTVRLVTPDDTVVAIPHNKIWSTAIHNDNSGKRELMCVVNFYLRPNHDGRKVERKLYDIAMASSFLRFDRPVLVVARERPFGTHYQLKAYPIDGRDQFSFVTDLTLRAKASFSHLGVEPAEVGWAGGNERIETTAN